MARCRNSKKKSCLRLYGVEDEQPVVFGARLGSSGGWGLISRGWVAVTGLRGQDRVPD